MPAHRFSNHVHFPFAKWSHVSLVALLISFGPGCDSAAKPAAAPSTPTQTQPTTTPAAAPTATTAAAPAKAPAPAPTPTPAPAATLTPSVSKEPGTPVAAIDTPAAAAKAAPVLISLADLTARRDLWPAKVALAKPFALSRSNSIPVGKELDVYEVRGANVSLLYNNELIECASADTDLLARASEYIATLTPEQLALTEATVAKQSDLWPLRLAITQTLTFQNGSQVPAGSEVVLRSLEGNLVSVYDRNLKTHFQAEIRETDLLVRARERVKLPQAERTPFFIRSVAAALEPASAGTADPNLEKTEFVLVYKSRIPCPRCHAFAPKLREFYDRIKPEHEGFEVIVWSEDTSVDEARKLFIDERLPGRLLAFDKKFEAADLASQSGQMLPLLFVLDRSGKVVTTNHPNAGKPTPEDTLVAIEKLLKEKR